MKPQADNNKSIPSKQEANKENAPKEKHTTKQVNLANMASALLAEIKQLKMQNQFLETSNERVTSYLARVQADRDVFRKESARLLERCAQLEATLEDLTKNQQKSPVLCTVIQKLSKLAKHKPLVRQRKRSKSNEKLSLPAIQHKLILILDKLRQHLSKVQRNTQEKVNNNLQQRRLEKAKIKRQKANEKQLKLIRQTQRPQVRRVANRLSDVEKDFFDYKTAQ